MKHEKLHNDAVGLLRKLISIPSVSRNESGTADVIADFLKRHGVKRISRHGNNVWTYNRHYSESKPTLMLCSHHDTVKPNPGYSRDPHDAAVEGDRLYGLGSNDAGASVVSLMAAFLHYYNESGLKYNLCLAIVAEEEISGAGGVRSILPLIGRIDLAIVGEPTQMNLAIAERGLMVLDCSAHGKSGHAARDEGDNAIYKAMRDIEWFRTYRFADVSPLFGEVKMSVTVIEAGTQHNVVPAECRFTVDCRVSEKYTNEEVLETVRANVSCDVTPRSTHLRPSSISPDHPIVKAGMELGMETFGSPTTSDQVALDMPSVKVGPGDSARSHQADEFILLSEIAGGIGLYIDLLGKIILNH